MMSRDQDDSSLGSCGLGDSGHLNDRRNEEVGRVLGAQLSGCTNRLGREPINLEGGRLARARHAPIATKFRSAAK